VTPGDRRRLGVAAPDIGGPGKLPVGENERAGTMIVSKAVVLAVLRERGLHARAAFVDRELPERIDSDQHGGLLATLHLDLAELAELADKPAP